MNKFYFVVSAIYVLCCTAVSVWAQNSDTPKQVSNTYFIKNCFVVTQPGVVLSGQNVIIKDGLISDIGTGYKPPFDAQIILADSMYVYAGFIEAYSNTGIAKAENKERVKVQNPGNPPNEQAGIMPQILASDLFKTSDKSVADMRSAGFVITHSAPRGLMLPGQSCIFALGDGQNDKMLIKAVSGQNFQLEANRGVYPSSSIAILAKFRDLYKNAGIVGAHDEKFKLNPAGLSRPDYTKELMSLYPVTVHKMSLYFVAPKTKDIHKALSLRDELGFHLILTEVKQGWHYIDKIKKNNIPVLLSLDLVEEDKKEAKKEDKPIIKKDSVTVKDVKKPEKVEKNIEKENFDAKKEASEKEYLTQASLFEKKGIKFGFSFLNVKQSDIRKNIRRMIENGLSESYALAALTTHPAQILGISHLAGTVEKGKLANLVVTDKPYFDEKSNIKYVFIDGKKYDYTDKSKKPDTKATEAGKYSGVWTYVVEVPGSTQKGKIKISKTNGELKVTVVDDSTPNEEDTASDVNLEGNNLTFNITTDMGQPMKADFDLRFEDKTYTGTVSVGQFGTFPIKGDFESDPKSN